MHRDLCAIVLKVLHHPQQNDWQLQSSAMYSTVHHVSTLSVAVSAERVRCSCTDAHVLSTFAIPLHPVFEFYGEDHVTALLGLGAQHSKYSPLLTTTSSVWQSATHIDNNVQSVVEKL